MSVKQQQLRTRKKNCDQIQSAPTRSATVPQQNPRPQRRLHGGNRRFYKESARVRSFVDWPVAFLSAEQMAAAGFYYTYQGDTVRCPFCNIEVGRWEHGDDPLADHCRWAPECRFIRGVETKNVPIGEESDSSEDEGRDVCGSGMVPSSLPRSAISRDPMEKNRNYVAKRPMSHPKYATYDARMASFAAWPKSMKLRPNQLSDAGFFYTGSGDMTICFHCDGGLKDWEETDDPWVEHAKNFSKCEYLLTAKGRDFVENVLASQKKSTRNASNSTARQNPSVSKSGESSSSEPSSSQARSSYSEESKLCKICYTEEMGAAFYPCGHVVACAKCASSLMKCAVCRKKVDGTLRVFLS